MILTLRTKNLALITDALLEFGEGLTVITGETGSGKSLLVNSLGLLAGKKGDSSMVREGTSEALVEGTFEVDGSSPVAELLEQVGIPFENPLVVRRILSRQGRNRVFINDSVSTLSTLRALSPHLMEIQSQKDHHSFLHPSRHVAILDAYAGLEGIHRRYLELYRQRERLRNELKEAEEGVAERIKRLEFLRFQLRELEEADLKSGEEEDLRRKREVLSKAARCKEGLMAAAGYLSENEPSAREFINLALGNREEWRGLKEEIGASVEVLEEALVAVEETSLKLISLAEDMNEDPEELQRVEERLDLIARFKPKYGETVDEMLSYLEEVREEISQLERSHESSQELKERLAEVEEELWRTGEELDRRRKGAEKDFCQEVEAILSKLRLEQARLSLQFSEGEPGPWGLSKVEFLIEPNPGEGKRPLWKVASGGELSRITLAIYSLLSHRGGSDLWVLDEVDTGIGGETAVEVGRLLKEIAKERQIVCITHLPQIAAFGDHHLRVAKRVEKDRTVTTIDRLTEGEMKEELKRMMGGEKIPWLGERDDSD